MARTNEPIFKLKLLVDKKKNKVVLAEADKDFVDVLFSLLTLPMGTIVRLLEKYQQNQKSQAVPVGCFNNVYKSVLELGNSSFMTVACREMLLHPRSEKENQRSELKLNIDDTNVLKYYRCTSSDSSSCKVAYSNFWSSKCRCGALMATEFETHRGVGSGETFVSDKFFTITDNMRVDFTSTGLTLRILKEVGYTDVDQLHEMNVDVNRQKVLALLQCLFSSETAFTDVFLMKGSSSDVKKELKMPSLPFREEGETESNELMSVTVFTRKLDKKVLYVESGKGFVDLLFTFLVLPLNSAWEMSGSNMVLGCVGKLLESFKSLSSTEGRKASTTSNTCILPWYYSCQRPLLDVGYAKRDSDRSAKVGYHYNSLKAMDPRCNSFDMSTLCSGFVKEGATFMISDDLIITPMNFSLTISTLKKWNMDLGDIEGQVINISKAEAIGLLRASLMTSAALGTVFGSLLQRKPKEEKL